MGYLRIFECSNVLNFEEFEEFEEFGMGTERLKEYFKRHDRVRTFELHQSTVHSVAWSCDGRRLASGSVDKTVGVSTLDNSRLVSHSKYSNNEEGRVEEGRMKDDWMLK